MSTVTATSAASTALVPALKSDQTPQAGKHPIHALTQIFQRGIAKLILEYGEDGVVLSTKVWRNTFRADARDEELTEEARQWWYSLDAITPFDGSGNPIYNCDTHHGFYLIPGYVSLQNAPKAAPGVPLDLETFDGLAGSQSNQRLSRFEAGEAYRQKKNYRCGASYFVALRKVVLFRKETIPRQRALMDELNAETEAQMEAMSAQLGNNCGPLTGTRYENFPNVRDLGIIARAHYVVTGELILGDMTGFEGYPTYSVTEQQVNIQERAHRVVVGGQSRTYGFVGESRLSGGLSIFHLQGAEGSDVLGVAGVRKFRIPPTQSPS